MENALRPSPSLTVAHVPSSEGVEFFRQSCRGCLTNVQRDSTSFRWYGGGQQRKECIYCRIIALCEREICGSGSPFTEPSKDQLTHTVLQVYEKWDWWVRSQPFEVRESREEVVREMEDRHAALMGSRDTLPSAEQIDPETRAMSAPKPTCRDCKERFPECAFIPLANTASNPLTAACIKCRIKKGVTDKKTALRATRFKSQIELERDWKCLEKKPKEMLELWKLLTGLWGLPVPDSEVLSVTRYTAHLTGKVARSIPRWFSDNIPPSRRNVTTSVAGSADPDLDSSSDFGDVEAKSGSSVKRKASGSPPEGQRTRTRSTNVARQPYSPFSSFLGKDQDCTPRTASQEACIVSIPPAPQVPQSSIVHETDAEFITQIVQNEPSSKMDLRSQVEKVRGQLTGVLASLSGIEETEGILSIDIVRHALNELGSPISKVKEAIEHFKREQELRMWLSRAPRV